MQVDTDLLGLLNKHAPEKEKVVPDRPSSPWINEAVIKAKQARRRAERKKRKTGLVVHIEIYKQARNRSCFFHIRSLSKVRPYITYKAASSTAVCLILSKLDYCNSLLLGLPQKQIKRLQAVQNAAARTVMKCKKTDHITPILRQLHWLPIRKRIRHKILSATYRSDHDNTPLYLSDLLQKHNPSRLLRSASRSLLDVPGPRDSKTKRYGQRAFRYVAPSHWNVLPESIKEKDSIQSFRPSLKTHFFTQG